MPKKGKVPPKRPTSSLSASMRAAVVKAILINPLMGPGPAFPLTAYTNLAITPRRNIRRNVRNVLLIDNKHRALINGINGIRVNNKNAAISRLRRILHKSVFNNNLNNKKIVKRNTSKISK